MKIGNKRIEDYLVLGMGIFSTFQLTEIGGITIFSALLFGYSLYSLIFKRKIKSDKYILLKAFFLIATLSEIYLFASGKYVDWRSSSLKRYILLMSIYVVYYFIKDRKENIYLLFKGIYISCFIQIIWSYAQFLLFKLFYININKLVFEQLLGMTGSLYHVTRNGQLKLSGINSNPGMLVPIIIMSLIISEKTYIKMLATLLAFLTGSSTPIVAVVFYWLLVLFGSMKHIEKKKLKRFIRLTFISLILVGCFFALYTGNTHELTSSFYSLLGRINSIRTNTISDGSTFAHYRYYSAIPYIYSNISLVYILIGYGIRCAGLPYVEFFNQYSSITWVPESDFVTYLFNVGFLGTVVFYSILIIILVKSQRNKYKKYSRFIATLLVSGFFYGIQLHWVILVEIILYFAVDNKMGEDFLSEIKLFKYQPKNER